MHDGKQNYYWNEYRLEGIEAVKFKCHRQKVFDGCESEWNADEEKIASWKLDNPDMSEWIRNYI